MEFKGKWHLSKDAFENNIISCDGFFLAEVRNDKNALLISKAPEMLEMLNKISNMHPDSNPISIIKECKQLIKEATEL
jgi:hypothetical protein